MDVQIQGRNLRVSEKLEDYARRKLDKLPRYLPNIADVYLELTREHTRRGDDVVIAQLTVRHSRGAILRSEHRGTEAELSTTLNHVIENMYRRIERFKGKQQRKGNGKLGEVFAATLEELEQAEAIPEEERTAPAPAVEPDYEPEVVRHKEVSVSPMSEREAIEQMELLGHNFFVFFNESTGGVNVLYKRTNGDYGVLVPVSQS